MTPPSPKPNKVEAELWRRGDLRFLLKEYNKPIYGALREYLADPDCRKFYIEACRGFSKTFTTLIIAHEECIRNPGTTVRFVTGFVSDLKKIVKPLIRILQETCPKELKPHYYHQEVMYSFANGSELHLHGTDNLNANKMRGLAADLIFNDEAGTMAELLYLYRSIQYQIVKRRDGKVGFISTPALTTDHDLYQIRHECQEDDYFLQLTIDDHPTWTDEDKAEAAKENGGWESTAFLREYYCEWITEQERAICKEWSREFILPPPKFQEIRDEEFYKFWHRYEALDMGFQNDSTACLFAHYNFKRAQLIIEDEIVAPGHELVTDVLAKKIREKEAELWTNESGAVLPVFRRVSDNNEPRFNHDMSRFHNLAFTRTSKDNLHAMVNELKIWVQQGRILVHERCEQLLGCLEYGIWDKPRKKFDQSKKYGHYDALAALIYLVRNTDQATNPIPSDYKFDPKTQHAAPGAFDRPAQGAYAVFGELFRRRR